WRIPGGPAPRRGPIAAAARTPSQGESLSNATPYALIAPSTRMPSRPRLMRPLRSVRHSPRLTNKNGVLTRIAPPNTAIKTPHQPSPPASISVRSRLDNAQAAVEGLAGENEH